MIEPLKEHHKDLLGKLQEIGLPNSVIRDFSSLLPILENINWVTSIYLRQQMRNKGFTKKEISRVSQALANIYNNSELLLRKEHRKIFMRFRGNLKSHWAYTLNIEYITGFYKDNRINIENLN